MLIHRHEVRGSVIDRETRCAHFHSERDIIAIKFACCGEYYPCFRCHEEHTGHPIALWGQERLAEHAILCGHCGYELTIGEYLADGARCPACGSPFNPGCHNHWHRYFRLLTTGK